MVVCIRAGKKQFKKSLQIIRFFCSAFKMSFDSEEAPVDRVRATAFFEAKEAGATFVTKKWVAERLNRSEKFLKILGFCGYLCSLYDYRRSITNFSMTNPHPTQN